MFNVGGPEIMVIILVALIVLGPQQLPKAMRTFGNVMGEIRKVSSGFQAEMKSAMDSFTDDEPAKDKPQSAPMASPTTPRTPSAAISATASTMEEADVTEVVGRNPEPDLEPGVAPDGAADPDGSADEPAARPAVDPADRAAG